MEPLIPSVLRLALVTFDADEDDAPPDEVPFVRPMPRPTPRTIAIRIAAASTESFHVLTCAWRQNSFEALPFSNIPLSTLQSVSREAEAGFLVGRLRNDLQNFPKSSAS